MGQQWNPYSLLTVMAIFQVLLRVETARLSQLKDILRMYEGTEMELAYAYNDDFSGGAELAQMAISCMLGLEIATIHDDDRATL